MTEFGLHVTMDVKGCSRGLLASQSFIYDLLNKLPEMVGMTKMTLPYVVPWMDKFSTTKIPGLSGFVMLAESHSSIHTFPDYNYAFVDIFSCNSFNSKKCSKLIKDVLQAENITVKNIKRGIDFPPKVYEQII